MLWVNGGSNVAVVALWLDPQEVRARLPSRVVEKVAAIGTLYSPDGVNYLLEALARSLLSVDTLLVFGRDLTGSGQALLDALSGACGEWLRLPCEALKHLDVRAVDLRGKTYEELAEAIEAAYRPRPPRQPVDLRLKAPEPQRGFPAPVGWAVVHDTEPRHAAVKALDYLLTYGFPTGGRLEAPLVVQLFPEAWGGAGGEPCGRLRLRRYGGWAAGHVHTAELDVGRLEGCLEAAVIRMAGAAARRGLKPLYVAVVTPAAYIPLDAVEEAAGRVERAWRAAYGRDVYDPRGNFVLQDFLRHYTPRGTLHRELAADRLALRREASKLLPDHAFYLGEEAAARELLGSRYVQERWRR